MKLKKTPAFELYNMDNPPINTDRERIVFRSYAMAQLKRSHYGGLIRPTFICEKES